MPSSIVSAVAGTVASKAIGGLFGSDGEQVESGSSTRVFPEYIPKELENIVTKTRTLMDKPYEAYTGQRVAGLNADEQSAFDTIRNLQGNYQAGLGSASNIANQVAQRGLGGFDQQTIDAFMNPYRTNVMDISRGRQLDQFDLQKRNLQQQQGAIGSFGGSRSALAQGQLYDNFSRQLAENEANQLFQGYSDAQNRAMAGTAMAGQQANSLANYALQGQQAGLQGAAALGQAGEVQRGLAQQGLDVNYQDFLTKQQYPYEQLKFGASLIDPIARTTSGQQTTGTQGSTGGPGIAGTALGLGAMYKGSGIGNSLQNSIDNMSGINSFFGNGWYNTQAGNTAALGNSINWFKAGGKVEDKMKYEENDLVSRLGSFYDMLQESSKEIQQTDPLDEQMYPNGPTRRQMLELWDNPEAMSGLGSYYKCGGKVKGYATGGLIGGMSPMGFFANYRQPEEEPQGISILDRLLNRGNYGKMLEAQEQLTGNNGLRDSFYNTWDKVHNSPLGQYARENPTDVIGTAMMGIPVAGPLASASLKGVGMLGKAAKLVAKNPKLASFLGGAGLLASGHMGDDEPVSEGAKQADAVISQINGEDPSTEWRNAAIAKTAGNPAFQENAGLTSTTPLPLQGMFSGQDAEDFPTGKQSFVPKQDAMEIPSSPQATQPYVPQSKERQMNLPLIQFGAAMLGSKNNFFKALGEAGSVYAKEKKDERADSLKAMKEELDRAIEMRRTAAYEQQVLQGVDSPYEKELRIMKLQNEILGKDQVTADAIKLMEASKDVAGRSTITFEQAKAVIEGKVAPTQSGSTPGWSINRN